ncbi:tyrosine-type recombinase/integrase [Spirillospora sp. NPDC048911]|uniref:tyrosine-type recombinase/integrase n=1 Tax=Spirillospora sp. NPDC048911 TaxID=3364527 RepID=UPI0037190648
MTVSPSTSGVRYSPIELWTPFANTTSAKPPEAWKYSDFVFRTSTGGELDAANVRRALRLITKRAGLGEHWTPRELRHSFVSIMSDRDVPIENSADLCGHPSPAVTGRIYRHQLKPVTTKGAGVMNAVFGDSGST